MYDSNFRPEESTSNLRPERPDQTPIFLYCDVPGRGIVWAMFSHGGELIDTCASDDIDNKPWAAAQAKKLWSLMNLVIENGEM